jgi:hypothetical protein
MLVSVSDLLHSSIVYYVLYDQEMEKNRCQSYDRSSLAEASKSQGAHERSPSMKWRISCNAFSISLMQTSIRKTVVVLPKIHPLNVYLFLPFLAVDKVLSNCIKGAMQCKLYPDAIELYSCAISLCENNTVCCCNRSSISPLCKAHNI